MSLEQIAPSRKMVLLIDLDNCPQELLQISDIAERYQIIVACHGHKEPRVPLGLASVIGELIACGRIEVVAMPYGKNAADFGLAFWAGRLSALVADDVEFHVASQDKDLDYAIYSLQQIGRRATRISGSAAVIRPAPASNNTRVASSNAASPNVSAEDVDSLCQRLVKVKRSFPNKREGLQNLLKGASPKLEAQRRALKVLESSGVITYAANGSVVCDFERLKLFPQTFLASVTTSVPDPPPSVNPVMVDVRIPSPLAVTSTPPVNNPLQSNSPLPEKEKLPLLTLARTSKATERSDAEEPSRQLLLGFDEADE